MPRIVLVALLLLACAARAEEPARVAGFAALPGADSLKIRYATMGCFHSATYELAFTAGATPRASATRLLLEWSEKDGVYVEKGREAVGEMALTAEDLRQLDALLAFYRAKPDGGCTTVEEIRVEQLRGGKLVAQESFTDASCSVHERKGVLSLGALLGRMQKK